MTVAEATRRFDFFRDTFAFRNELIWEYFVDEETGQVTTRKNEPPPTYGHRCFVVVRSARQFLFHARFVPDRPAISEREYSERVRKVVKRAPWDQSSESERIEFPGFGGLREFSESHERVLKENCGGMWQSYINRKHWRMLVPFSRGGQARESERLLGRLDFAPILHVVRFPQLTINHAVLAFDGKRTADGINFQIYDPNLSEGPSTLLFSKRDNTFHLPRNIYWAGGRVDVYETYTG